MASIGEAEYAAAFHYPQIAAGLRKSLADLGYPPQPAPISSSITPSPPESPSILSNLSVRRVLTCSFIGYAIVYRCKNLLLSGAKEYTIWQIFSPNLYRSKTMSPSCISLFAFPLLFLSCLLVALSALNSGATTSLLEINTINRGDLHQFPAFLFFFSRINYLLTHIFLS